MLRLADMGREATIQHVFELVLRLKQICNFDPATGASSKLERLEADLEEVRRQRPQGDRLQPVGRDARPAARAGSARSGRCEYHGGMPAGRPRRGDPTVPRRAATTHVLLMSYGAGGVGLNLQFAEYVFLFDRWWNPAVEDQAINRAHRIGAAGAGHRDAVSLRSARSRSGSTQVLRREAGAVRDDLLAGRRPDLERPLRRGDFLALRAGPAPPGRRLTGRRPLVTGSSSRTTALRE